MDSAAFSLSDYKFDQVILDFSKKESNKVNIKFEPEGIFHSGESVFELVFVFLAFSGDNPEPFIKIRSISYFKFASKISFEDIPSFFYVNSLAIIFPYVRSFVSTVTLQANILPPILIPTWNLTSLNDPLRENTRKI